MSSRGLAGSKVLPICSQATSVVPVRDEVTGLAFFELDLTEVSRARYAQCRDAGRCATPGLDRTDELDDRPITGVSWEQARAYCQWRGRDLPTLALWEAATMGATRRHPWGDAVADCERANVDGCGGCLAPVNSLPRGAGPYGSLHLAGNAAEWLLDAEHRARRGSDRRLHAAGSYRSSGSLLAYSSASKDTAPHDVGFRCARQCRLPAGQPPPRPAPPEDTTAPRAGPFRSLRDAALAAALDDWVRRRPAGSYQVLSVELHREGEVRVRERARWAGSCREGIRVLEVDRCTSPQRVTWEASIYDCCQGEVCTRNPAAWILHLGNAIEAGSVDAVRRLIHPRRGLAIHRVRHQDGRLVGRDEVVHRGGLALDRFDFIGEVLPTSVSCPDTFTGRSVACRFGKLGGGKYATIVLEPHGADVFVTRVDEWFAE